ncbi:ABC transporter substrate-binding protein [Geminicoccaceae bacterium 1502E]|nr:ABC transporter substrate-binding protein [Geminicoccaceae bacterium 1502E]
MLPAAAAAGVADEEAAARMLVERLGQRVIEILADDEAALEARLGALLQSEFDLPLLARLALGLEYRRMNASQKAEYERLFTDLVLKTYSQRLRAYSGERFAVLGSSAAGRGAGGDVLVRTEIRRPADTPIRVDWRVRQLESGPRVIDMVVEGASFVVTQRSEFLAIAQQHGIDGLLDMLRGRVEAASAT